LDKSSSIIPKHSSGWKISWKKTCGNTTIEMGRHQEGLLTAAEYKRMEETSRGLGYLKVNY
jgi:hypothetical protein